MKCLLHKKGTGKMLGIKQISYAVTACVHIYNLIQMRQIYDGWEFAVLLIYLSNFLKLQKMWWWNWEHTRKPDKCSSIFKHCNST
jgi:hypothetical protein